jgi:ATP-dependent DNA helicase RecG
VLFAKDARRWNAGCFVRIMIVQGKEKLSGEAFNVKNDEVVAGNILRLTDSAWERLTYALSSHTQLTESARFQTTFLFPQIAVREALMNAIVHRNYAIEGRGIEVAIYQDRMEILSPGMLLSTISV